MGVEANILLETNTTILTNEYKIHTLTAIIEIYTWIKKDNSLLHRFSNLNVQGCIGTFKCSNSGSLHMNFKKTIVLHRLFNNLNLQGCHWKLS